MTKPIDKYDLCVVCDKPVPDYEPIGCCDGRECGCMGQAIEPCVCSSDCWNEIMNPAKPTDNIAEIQARHDELEILYIGHANHGNDEAHTDRANLLTAYNRLKGELEDEITISAALKGSLKATLGKLSLARNKTVSIYGRYRRWVRRALKAEATTQQQAIELLTAQTENATLSKDYDRLQQFNQKLIDKRIAAEEGLATVVSAIKEYLNGGHDELESLINQHAPKDQS